VLNLKICLKQPKWDSGKTLSPYCSIIEKKTDSTVDFLKAAKWNPSSSNRFFLFLFSELDRTMVFTGDSTESFALDDQMCCKLLSPAACQGPMKQS